jgi:hypothetical protein
VRALPAALLAAREQLDAERPRSDEIAVPSAAPDADDEQMTLFEERA